LKSRTGIAAKSRPSCYSLPCVQTTYAR